jgi:signal recognition particle receptor subunit beta
MPVTTSPSTHTIEILVTGLPEAGKSTFLDTISTRTGNAQGWYCGDVQVDEALSLKFLEPPGLRHFDFMWLRELIEHVQVPGFLVICDSTRPEYFGAVVALLETIHFNHPKVPCILVTNKQDDEGAWSSEDIRMGLGIPDFIEVIPCRAQNRADVKRVVVQMLYKILG